MDKDPQALFRGSGLHLFVKPGDRATPRVIENRGVKLFLVPEVVVDGRNVGFRLLADFPDGGIAETVFGKNLACRLKQALPSLGIFIFSRHRTIQTIVSNIQLKHLIYVVNRFFQEIH